MAFREELQRKHVLIVGFSERTGFACAAYLLGRGIAVSISDCRPDSALVPLKNALPGKLVHFYTGTQMTTQLQGIDLVILSPGVPRSIPLICAARKLQIPVLSEIDLACLLLPAFSARKVVGVTGTDGKTTSASLIAHLLQEHAPTFLVGNSGRPVISVLDDLPDDAFLVLELSSFMLEELQCLRCDVACLLNLAEDHLDRYDSFAAYRQAKYNIFALQGVGDFAVLNMDDPWYEESARAAKAQILRFSTVDAAADLFCDGSAVYVQGDFFLRLADLPQVLQLYRENLLAALTVLFCLGLCDVERLYERLLSFRGVPHRYELVGRVGGVSFVNDSKATSPHALIYALKQSRSVILLMGGVLKSDCSVVSGYLRESVKYLLLFGQDREKIARQIHFAPMEILTSLHEAFLRACVLAVPGDVVLLSPAAASFDQFQNYEARGLYFRNLVHNWANSSGK